MAHCAAFDARPTRTRIGLVLLATDHTTERDFERVLVPLGISVHCNRIAYANPTTAENLRRMIPRLTEGAALILPGEDLDAIYYACTAASVAIGDAVVVEAIRAAKPDVPATTPTLAARAAFLALGVRRLALLTPYTRAVTEDMAAYFRAAGLEIARATCFGLEDDREMARLTGDAIVAAAQATIGDDDEALFVSCTALRAFEAVDRIERAIGRPVVTSNQAGLWQALHLAGVTPPANAGGQLMRVAPAAAVAEVA
ncbi:MAG: ectoine utilization protein EutA [Alphaproteobacteria bacterium]